MLFLISKVHIISIQQIEQLRCLEIYKLFVPAEKQLHSVSEYKKRYIRNSTQILEKLRNAVVGFFGLRNEFVNVQRNQ